MRVPLLYMQYRMCTPENGLTPNLEGIRTNPNGPGSGPYRLTFVVYHPTHTDEPFCDTRWMDDPNLITDDKFGHYVTQIGLDLVDVDGQYIYDYDDVDQSRREAMAKMKQLWAEFDISI